MAFTHRERNSRCPGEFESEGNLRPRPRCIDLVIARSIHQGLGLRFPVNTSPSVNKWSPPQKAVRRHGSAQGTFFIIKIKEVQQHRLHETPILSYGVITAEFKAMLGIRMYPNGVDGGKGTHVALFVQMMRGEYDSILDWPFTGRISVSIMDQSGAECRNHISRDIQATRQPGLVAFQVPAEDICRTGYGFVKFAPIGELFGPRYVKNGELFLKLEFA